MPRTINLFSGLNLIQDGAGHWRLRSNAEDSVTDPMVHDALRHAFRNRQPGDGVERRDAAPGGVIRSICELGHDFGKSVTAIFRPRPAPAAVLAKVEGANLALETNRRTLQRYLDEAALHQSVHGSRGGIGQAALNRLRELETVFYQLPPEHQSALRPLLVEAHVRNRIWRGEADAAMDTLELERREHPKTQGSNLDELYDGLRRRHAARTVILAVNDAILREIETVSEYRGRELHNRLAPAVARFERELLETRRPMGELVNELYASDAQFGDLLRERGFERLHRLVSRDGFTRAELNERAEYYHSRLRWQDDTTGRYAQFLFNFLPPTAESYEACLQNWSQIAGYRIAGRAAVHVAGALMPAGGLGHGAVSIATNAATLPIVTHWDTLTPDTYAGEVAHNLAFFTSMGLVPRLPGAAGHAAAIGAMTAYTHATDPSSRDADPLVALLYQAGQHLLGRLGHVDARRVNREIRRTNNREGLAEAAERVMGELSHQRTPQALPRTEIPAFGVTFFGRDVYERFFRGARVLLGPPNGDPAFFMPLEDARQVRTAGDVARYTGMAPSIERAYVASGDVTAVGEIFGVVFPTAGFRVFHPTSGNIHYLRGGNTAVRLEGDNAGFLVNPVRELIVRGGRALPAGSTVFQLGPRGAFQPIRQITAPESALARLAQSIGGLLSPATAGAARGTRPISASPETNPIGAVPRGLLPPGASMALMAAMGGALQACDAGTGGLIAVAATAVAAGLAAYLGTRSARQGAARGRGTPHEAALFGDIDPTRVSQVFDVPDSAVTEIAAGPLGGNPLLRVAAYFTGLDVRTLRGGPDAETSPDHIPLSLSTRHDPEGRHVLNVRAESADIPRIIRGLRFQAEAAGITVLEGVSTPPVSHDSMTVNLTSRDGRIQWTGLVVAPGRTAPRPAPYVSAEGRRGSEEATGAARPAALRRQRQGNVRQDLTVPNLGPSWELARPPETDPASGGRVSYVRRPEGRDPSPREGDLHRLAQALPAVADRLGVVAQSDGSVSFMDARGMNHHLAQAGSAVRYYPLQGEATPLQYVRGIAGINPVTGERTNHLWVPAARSGRQATHDIGVHAAGYEAIPAELRSLLQDRAARLVQEHDAARTRGDAVALARLETDLADFTTRFDGSTGNLHIAFMDRRGPRRTPIEMSLIGLYNSGPDRYPNTPWSDAQLASWVEEAYRNVGLAHPNSSE